MHSKSHMPSYTFIAHIGQSEYVRVMPFFKALEVFTMSHLWGQIKGAGK